ncbi:glycerophosphocholine phosphodiesterase GPCPD1 isoform X2 [Procambarus clarkii]|uniref:glycerophosphocholine phosphodiesterase GPCPD1 isoform X2 n=1 Tax=Procambarus clarkii TaxID=6728 RepID=UPI001E673E07|nr:glycerophosphocholine phosphodiesterase GPCPD1-like isoform X2 [Procambarus clarkii]
MIESRLWTFRVSCQVAAEEQVCVVGNCESLGTWDSQRVIPLYQEDPVVASADNVWSASVQIPFLGVEYRYCVCIILEPRPGLHDRAVVVRRWETNIAPRKIPDAVSSLPEPQIDHFGSYGGFERVDQGWLVKDSLVQLRLCKSTLYNDPVMLFKRRYQNKNVRVKVTPIDLNISPLEPHMGGIEESTDFDISSLHINTRPTWPVTEVAVMKEELCRFHQQDQFGVVCNNGDHVVFQCHMLKPESNVFLCDFYIEDSSEDVPRYLGCSYILPSNMKENYGVANLPITSPKHIPIGQLTVHYMVVCPMEYGGDMSVSYARHWKDSWKGLEVGHRGAGNSYHSEPKSCANIRENTVASLKYAAEKGADMVEFDVQLSKDLVPVIYHDFHACIALKRKKEHDKTDLLEIPIKDLTLSQLQALKVYHKKEKGLSRFCDEEFEDHQPFPTLQRALESVPYTCGFNVEVKWTMLLRDGTYELQHPFELNHFMDLIIKMILEHSGKRKIVFSCFHPDICTMLRLKQNRYPVMFLTQGVSEVWPPYEDSRTSSIPHAILYAVNADILGINVHTEDLMRDHSQMKMAMDYNLIVFCWGDDNNDQENIKFLKKAGLHGIIYDKIDEYNTKEKKESIFLCEEREAAMMSATAAQVEDTVTGGDGVVSPGPSGFARPSDRALTITSESGCNHAGSLSTTESNVATSVHYMATNIECNGQCQCNQCKPTSFSGILTK